MSKKTVEIDISELENGKNKIITNIDGNIVMTDFSQSVNEEKAQFSSGIEQATYDFQRQEHLITRLVTQEGSTYVTTISEIQELAKNTQNDIEKIKKINSIVQYYVNQDDVIGRVVELIENNINTEYKINFPMLPKGRSQGKFKDNLELIVDTFLNDIDVVNFIKRAVTNTFMFGNYIPYLKGDANTGFVIEEYPLGILEISPYKIDGEPLITMNVNDLKQALSNAQTSYQNLKSLTINIPRTVDDEIKNNYPEEVVAALNVKDKLCFMNPERTSAVRINNFNGLYGVTPIFKAMKSLLMLDTYANVDNSNAKAKAKKIYHQVLRKEVLTPDGTRTKHANEIAYAHASLMAAMQKQTVIVTSPAYVEKIEILEPKVTETDPDVILSHRTRVLDALGIGFVSTEQKISFSTVDVNVNEILKTINKIIEQIETVLNKFLKAVCIANNIDVMYAPVIGVHQTQNFTLDARYKIIDLLYSKIGASYKTIFNILGKEFDFDTEVRSRLEEQIYEVDGVTYNLDDVFTPHVTSFTLSGGGNSANSSGTNKVKGTGSTDTNADSGTDGTTSRQKGSTNQDADQKAADAKRYQTKVNQST